MCMAELCRSWLVPSLWPGPGISSTRATELVVVDICPYGPRVSADGSNITRSGEDRAYLERSVHPLIHLQRQMNRPVYGCPQAMNNQNLFPDWCHRRLGWVDYNRISRQ